MGTNPTGCTEWERDFHPVTEKPTAEQATASAAPTDDEYVSIVDGLRRQIETYKGDPGYRRRLEVELHMVTQYRRLDLGVRAIRRAAIRGDVCDEVPWFDTIFTLLDYCSILLEDDVSPSAIEAPSPYPHRSRRPQPKKQRVILRRRP